MFFIVKARFKEITESELAKHLIDLIYENKLKFVPCMDVRKVVFFINAMHSYGYEAADINNRCNNSDFNKKYEDNEYSFNDIKELAKNY